MGEKAHSKLFNIFYGDLHEFVEIEIESEMSTIKEANLLSISHNSIEFQLEFTNPARISVGDNLVINLPTTITDSFKLGNHIRVPLGEQVNQQFIN